MSEIVEAEVVEEADLFSGDASIMTPQNIEFAKLIASGKGPTEAYKITRPESKASARSMANLAYKLAKNPKVREQIAILQEAVRLQIISEAPAAFVRLKELAESAEGEKVKLQANLEILDRAGLKPPQRVEQIQIGLWGSLSSEDMRNIIRRRVENQ